MNSKNKLKALSKKVRLAILTAALFFNTATSNTLLAHAAEDDSSDSEVAVASDEGSDNGGDGDNDSDEEDSNESAGDARPEQEEGDRKETADAEIIPEASETVETNIDYGNNGKTAETTMQTDAAENTEPATAEETTAPETEVLTEETTEEETTEEELTETETTEEENTEEKVTLVFDEAQKASTKSFLRSIDRVKSFVIYARDYTPYTHIDGNIAVKNLNRELEALKAENNKAGSGYISYIESINNGAKIAVNNHGTVVLGNANGRSDICPNNNNGRLVDLSEVSKTDASAVRAALQNEGIRVNFANLMLIDGNLASICTAAKAVSPANGGSGKEAIQAVCGQLESGELKAGDVIAIEVDAGVIGGDVERLYNINKNKGATIVFNMTGLEGDNVSLYQPVNSTPYAKETAYFVFNFGYYAG